MGTRLDEQESKQHVSFCFILHGPIGDYQRIKDWIEQNVKDSVLKFKTWAPYPLYAVGHREYFTLQSLIREGKLEVKKVEEESGRG